MITTFRELLESSLQRIELKYKKSGDGMYDVYTKSGDYAGQIYKTEFDKKSYDVDINYGDFKEFKGRFKNLKLAKEWIEEVLPFKREDTDYRVYHSTYTRAIQEVEKYAKKLGYSFDEYGQEGEQLATEVGTGPAKPKNGKTNRFSFELYKRNKLQRKYLHVQIYADDGDYELNMYIN